MAGSEPQLSVRSAKAPDLAHCLARRENRSIADIVERALESYEIREARREPAMSFYARLSQQSGTDIDLDVVIKEGKQLLAEADWSKRSGASVINWAISLLPPLDVPRSSRSAAVDFF